MGIIKGSTKRVTPEYLRPSDSPLDTTDPFCIECHHFLPIYLLGGHSCIDLCTFSNNRAYNRIKCPTLGDIVKIKSYEQRVTVLDNNGNMCSYSFDDRITGNCVFAMRKASIVDFCSITPTTYGVVTSSHIQVVDSLIHPNRQVVFKVPINQSPLGVDYFRGTKLSVLRRNDMLVYDIRMDVMEENRDIKGKAKCMVSNYTNRVLVGRSDGRVRVMDITNVGEENDYDLKCISSKS